MDEQTINKIEADLSAPKYPYWIGVLVSLGILVFLYVVSRDDYVLFHTFAEIFATIAGGTIFLVIWNASRRLTNHFYLVVGISFLSVAMLRLLHAFAYKGLGQIFFHSYDISNLATQLWLAGSIIQAASFVAATLFIKRRARPWVVLAVNALFIFGFLISILYFRSFPSAFVSGSGLTSFKIISEYVISAVYLATIYILIRNKRNFDQSVYRITIASVALLVTTELTLALYNDAGIINLVGHFFEIIAYYLFYRALVFKVIYKPEGVIFRELKESEKELRESNAKLHSLSIRLAKEKEETQALLSSIGDGVVATDSCGRITFVNQSFMDLFDLDHKEILDSNLGELLPMYDEKGKFVPLSQRPIGKALYHTFGTRVRVVQNDRFYFKKKDNSVIRLFLTASPILNHGRLVGVMGICRDITKEKELENTKLEFVSFAAHQLRTPLTTIKLTTELLSRSKKRMNPDMRETISNMDKDIDVMKKLVDTFLNVARIQSGKLQISPAKEDVHVLIKDVIVQSNILAKAKNIKIEENFDKDIPSIKIDQNIFYIILENYITNAIKYSPENELVIVQTKLDPKHLQIEVTNGGVGIPRVDHLKVFNQMFRSNNTTGAEGSGIGLYLVRLIAKQCGAKVWFDSPSPHYKNDPKNIGSTFYLSLPLSGMKKR
jgi:PAS domain S-box-containing protein